MERGGRAEESPQVDFDCEIPPPPPADWSLTRAL